MNNDAPELSPEARRLINEARRADDPTAEDHARVKARWLASVAAVAGVSSLTEAARAAGTVSWGFKAVGAALVIAAGAIGLNFALDTDGSEDSAATQAAPLPGRSSSAPERSEKTPQPQTAREQPAPGAAPRTADPAPGRELAPVEAAEPAQPQVAEVEMPSTGAAPSTDTTAAEVGIRPPGVSSAEPVSEPQPVAQASASRARPAARVAAARASAPKASEKSKEAASAAPAPIEEAPTAAGPSGQLSEELALLSDVRSSIQEGAGARALDLLDRYEARFGEPILGMEADALRVDALCKAGQRDAARESARAFQNEWPGSPLERRVSAACP